MIMRLLAKNVEAEVVDSSPIAFKQLPSLGFEVSGIGFVLLGTLDPKSMALR